ncbi:MAG: hypothetical protein JW841_07240 [Deltaproteobacteria bacterium]|nr:hypothetical protein [Deltaproteobacteria bacterium]
MCSFIPIDQRIPNVPNVPNANTVQAVSDATSNKITCLSSAITLLIDDIASIQQIIAQLEAEFADLEIPDPANFQKTETRSEGSPPNARSININTIDTAAFNAAMTHYQQKLQSLRAKIDSARNELAQKENELAARQQELADAQDELTQAQQKFEETLPNDPQNQQVSCQEYEALRNEAEEAQRQALEAQAQAQKAQDELQRSLNAIDEMYDATNKITDQSNDDELQTFIDNSTRTKNIALANLTSAKDHLPRRVDDQVVPPLHALSTANYAEITPKLASIEDGVTAKESEQILKLVDESTGFIDPESFDRMEDTWRAAGFSDADVIIAMLRMGNGKSENVEAAVKKIRELLDESGVFNFDVTHNELKQINDILHGLNRVEKRVVFDALSDEELQHWAKEINSKAILGFGGLSADEKKDLMNMMAESLASRQLVEFAKTLGQSQDTITLAQAISAKSTDYTKGEFLKTMINMTTDIEFYEYYKTWEAIDINLAEKIIKETNNDHARACWAVLLVKNASKETDPELKHAQYVEAEAIARSLLATNSGNALAAQALGEILMASGKIDETIEQMTAVIEANPRAAYAYYWRGMAYNQQRKIAREYDDLKIFVKLVHSGPERNLAIVLMSAIK